MQIIVDTREQTPWKFPKEKYDDVELISQKLDQGDYSLVGHEHRVCIERKNKDDYLMSITSGRQRFERECTRLSEIEFPFIVIEGTISRVLTETILRRRMTPQAVLGTTVSWSMKYGIQYFFVDNWEWAQETAYRIFKNYLKNFTDESNVKKRRKQKISV
jgi:ERCC4-type nuclease